MGDILGLGWKGQLVVKFDQLLGAAHAKHWSKYAFQIFKDIEGNNKGNNIEIFKESLNNSVI